jgi:hypothetical protein
MPFNTISYLAGVATASVAVAFGFAGGFTMTNPAKVEPPNRLERVAANAPLLSSQGALAAAPLPQPDAAAVPPAAAPESATPKPVAVQQPPAQEQSAQQPAAAPTAVVARDDAAELARIREADAKAAERKRAQHRRWAERRRHRQELDAATAPVRQFDRDDGEQMVVQRGPVEMPRFGFFGNND